jgi:hypothetical protein
MPYDLWEYASYIFIATMNNMVSGIKKIRHFMLEMALIIFGVRKRDGKSLQWIIGVFVD